VTKRLTGVVALVAVAMLAAGCAAGQAFRQGNAAMGGGNLDLAVTYYRKAVQASPDNLNYKIALERAMLAASRAHIERAREFEQSDQLEAALGEYKQAAELDPSNRQAAAKIAAIERTIREQIEAARPKPPIQAMRERARQASAEPILNPASREPINIRFNNASLRDILNFIANATGINVMYDREYTDRPTTVQLDGVTLEQALNQIFATNQLSYKVLNERSILVFADTPPKHAQYDEQVVRTFYVSHADATELSQILSTIIRLPGMAVQPSIAANKTSNTITVRATNSVAQIIEKIIEQNDKPRAEVVVDVEILEVNRTRAKQFGLNLSEYALGGIFSPETSPNSATTSGGAVAGVTPSGSVGKSPPAINLNTISRGVSTTDFYLAVPTAIVRFLESDEQTKLIAKPQLRGTEGAKLTLNLGQEYPVISTSFTPVAGGGAAVNPLASYQYKSVGVNLEMTPRVTLEGDILLELTVENSAVGAGVTIQQGQTIPSFVSRKVTTRLRLRDGESNLLAGLLQENERKSLSGFPGAIHVPGLKQLFSANDQQIQQTDLIMLLTPHIVRSLEVSESDLRPIYIGSQQNLALGGPPPMIATAPETPGATGAPGATPPTPSTAAPGAPVFPAPSGLPTTGGAVAMPPPGTSPIPGTVLVQPPPRPTPTPNVTSPAPPELAQTAAPSAPAAGTQAAAAPEAPTTTPGIGSAQVLISPPAGAFRVGGGPYTVPLSIVDVSRLSNITLTMTYDPSLLRVRSVQEGSFMRQGSAAASFTQQAAAGRIDITVTRTSDAVGASGTGLLAAVLFDAIAPGSATLSLNGAATGPGGTAMGLQFRPVTVTVQP
jgi:general secretion pathway protein D